MYWEREEAFGKIKVGLRAIYRTLVLAGANPLRDAHPGARGLDAAVLAAYGFAPSGAPADAGAYFRPASALDSDNSLIALSKFSASGKTWPTPGISTKWTSANFSRSRACSNMALIGG